MAVVENRIFINGVPQSATREDLAAHFSQFGTTVDVFMPAAFGAPGTHKGICFVTFASAESANYALKTVAHLIHGQPVAVEACIAKKGEGKGLPGFTNAGERLFVTNIPPDVTQEEVQAYFAHWGDWTDLYMPRGSFPGGHKGICFISYKEPAAVQQVMQHGSHALRGQGIVVDVAVPRGDFKGAGKGLGYGFPAAVQGGPVAVAPPENPGYNYGYSEPWTLPMAGGCAVPAAAATEGAAVPGGGAVSGRLFITKMHRSISKEDLTTYFQQYGDLNDVYVPPGGKLIAFVGFCDAAASQAVLVRKTHEVKPGCTVDVDMAIDRPPLGTKGQGKVRFQPYQAY